MSASYLRVRAAADRTLALVSLVAFAPLFALVALVVLVGSGLPIVVRLRRVGVNGTDFLQLKFRTMRPASGPQLTSGDDNRITAVGALLRRTRLDELPQLLNIARGDMALIGSRPEAPAYFDDKCAVWSDILAFRPGIAGAAQAIFAPLEPILLRGATAETNYRNYLLPAKLAADQWYLQNASPLLDLRIMITCFGASVLPNLATSGRRSLCRKITAFEEPLAWRQLRAVFPESSAHLDDVLC